MDKWLKCEAGVRSIWKITTEVSPTLLYQYYNSLQPYVLQPPTCKEIARYLTSLLSCLPDPCCPRQPLVVAVFKMMWGAQAPIRMTLGANTDKSLLISQWRPWRQHREKPFDMCACVSVCVRACVSVYVPSFCNFYFCTHMLACNYCTSMCEHACFYLISNVYGL